MSAYVYARVSTFEQYVNGYSIDEQVRLCLEHAKACDLLLGVETNCDLPGVFLDGGKSAYKKRLHERPGGRAMLAALKPGDTVIAIAPHRLFRRLGDTVATMDAWVQQGVAVKFTEYPGLNTDTANGKALLYMMAVMAQLKSELISSRVRESQSIHKVKAPPKPPKPVVPVHEVSTKDLGSILQQLALDREPKPFQFSGTVRAYIRCSTKDQTVEHQRSLIEKLMPHDMQGAPIVWYVDTGVSAFKTKFEQRPAGGKLINELQPGDMVLGWRPDRLFRSLMDTHRVIKMVHDKGASVATVEGNLRTDTLQGRMLFQILGMFAEMESQDIGRAVRMATFSALAKSDKARSVRLPKFLSQCVKRGRERHYSFKDCFNFEEMFLIHIELYMTQKNYRDRRTACRVISNKWLSKKGLPPLKGEYGERVQPYLARLQKLQKEDYTERRQWMIDRLSKRDPSEEMRYVLNIETIAWVDRRQKAFLKIAKSLPGRLVDKQRLVAMAGACAQPAEAVELFGRLT